MVDNLIKIYPADAEGNDFLTMGYGVLRDASKCVVTEERNGNYELSMTYDTTGIHAEYIIPGNIIKCKAHVDSTRPNKQNKEQLFRIAQVEKYMDGTIEVTAYHISYDLRYWCGGFKNWPPKSYLTKHASPKYLWDYFFKPSAPSESDPTKPNGMELFQWPNLITGGPVIPFTFDSDFGTWEEEYPAEDMPSFDNLSYVFNAREYLFGDPGVLNTFYTGEIECDNYDLYLHKERGVDNNVLIMYGKNLLECTQELNDTEVYDGVMVYYKSSDSSASRQDKAHEDQGATPERFSGSGDAVYWRDPANKGRGRVYALNVADYFSSYEDYTTVNAAYKEATGHSIMYGYAMAWLNNPDHGGIRMNITVSFFSLRDTVDYENIAPLESVELCDTVTVYHPDMGVNVKTKVVKTSYNVITGSYDEIELGTIGETLGSMLAGMASASGSMFIAQGSSSTQKQIESIIANGLAVKNVKYISDTQFSVTVGALKQTADEGEYVEETSEDKTNVYVISTSGSNTIFTNTTNGRTITFEGWPS